MTVDENFYRDDLDELMKNFKEFGWTDKLRGASAISRVDLLADMGILTYDEARVYKK
jgi:hypothetical protein